MTWCGRCPSGFSSNQGVIVLLALIIVPGLLLQSPLLSALLLLMGFAIVQQPRERVVTAAIFGLLLALPMIERQLSDMLTWSTDRAASSCWRSTPV